MICIMGVFGGCAGKTPNIVIPPNQAAGVVVDSSCREILLQYRGGIILRATIRAAMSTSNARKGMIDLSSQRPLHLVLGDKSGIPNTGRDNEDLLVRVDVTESRGTHDSLEQRLRFHPIGVLDNPPLLELRGVVKASEQAFPGETLSQAQQRFPYIRSTVGLSSNLRNNALYDRRFDWIIEGPGDGATRIKPLSQIPDSTEFSFICCGEEIELIFRPRFYQRHKNIPYFEPWYYILRKDSITGWCSWWAYMSNITEKNVSDMCDIFAAKLKDFGYKYIQIDDGYQSSNGGLPDNWLHTNEKFPGGLKGLADLIRARGLKPALWVNVHFGNEKFAKSNKNFFVLDPNADPHKGPWIDYALDASNPLALDTVVRPTYRELHRLGFEYVKIDTLRHLLYDAYYPRCDYFEHKGIVPEEAYRLYLQAARQELGPETYILACWGVLPEVVGFANGCRLGGDGFGPSMLQQYNSWNNVVWRNDPDHCDIAGPREEIIRPTLVSMAGGQLLLTDKLEVYLDERKLEGARRASPVLFNLPGQFYDYSPQTTDNLVADLRNFNGGSHDGPIDADRKIDPCPWWLLEINMPFESWNVLARLDWKDLPEILVKFAELGLPVDRSYAVYEFWTQSYLGVFRESFTAPAQPAVSARVYSIREKLDRPQVLSTNRHITQGGVDLIDVKWDAKVHVLSGRSSLVKDDPYTIVISLPSGFEYEKFDTNARQFTLDKGPEPEIIRCTMTHNKTSVISWLLKVK